MSGRPSGCNHEDWPCCGCGTESSQEEQHEQAMEMAELNGDFDREPDDDDFEDGRDENEIDHETLSLAGERQDEDFLVPPETPLGELYGGE